MAREEDLSVKTDHIAHRIEFVTGAKWTPEQYKAVCSILRLYRQAAMRFVLDTLREQAQGDSGTKEAGNGGK